MRFPPRGGGARHVPHKGRLALSFMSFFVLSFLIWIVLLITINSSDDEDKSGPNAEGFRPSTPSNAIDVERNEQQESSNSQARIPDDYSPALVVMTSTNGVNRDQERQTIFNALCSGQNAELIKTFKISIYLSIDAVDKPPELSIPASCEVVGRIKQLYQQSSTAKDFSGTGTGRIAAHYKAALKNAFQKHTHVIFLEDDLVPSFDFISLFTPGSPALDALETEPKRVWCVSAWNDMGVKTHASNLQRLFRTDFFPGLGWMTSRTLYNNLIRRKWPDVPSTGWDNWLRSNNDLERECIVPEVNRVHHISKSGVNVRDPSNALYGKFSFPSIANVNDRTNWVLEGGPTSAGFEKEQLRRLRNAKRVDYFKTSEIDLSQGGDLLVVYERSQFPSVLSRIGAHPPMIEPRSGWKGVIPFRRSEDSDDFIYLCDLVQCASSRLFPDENLVKKTTLVRGAPRGKSCTATCQSYGKVCDPLNLQTIAYPAGRACTILRTHFDCNMGCGHQIGVELPAQVVGNIETKGQCLTGESAVPKCDAFHEATRRLCSCVDP